jgi:hypothetical protein
MKPQLTVLSFGAGQDSTCLLYKFALDKEFRERWIKGRLIVIMSDTGNEHPHTYNHINFIETFCAINDIPFYFITPDLGYHPNTWQSLQGQFTKNHSIMSIAFPKACTDNLKIKPLYSFLDHYIAKEYFGYSDTKVPKGKKYLKAFATLYGKINVILGIAHGEEKRIANVVSSYSENGQMLIFEKEKEDNLPKWMKISINRLYPLVEEKMDRLACQKYIRSVGLPLPYPSNCIMCPYLSKIEILWLYRTLPQEFEKWVNHENRKLEKNISLGKKNLGVKGEKMLVVYLKEAIEEFGHLSIAELNKYKMSHGHCVMSSY